MISYLSSVFDSIDVKKRGSDQKDPEIFRFNSTRFIGKQKTLRGFENNPVCQILFEIQIRSAFEHAWSVATHSLTYKTNTIDWRLLRFTAQLKSSVEQLDMLISGYNDIYQHITKHSWTLIDRKVELLNFINTQIENNKIPKEIIPNDLSRFCDNIIDFIIACPNQRNKLVYSNLLSNILTKLESEFNLYDNSTFPRSISLFQLILGIIIRHFKLTPDHEKYTVVITEGLETLFPEIKNIKNGFNFNITT